MVMGTGAVDTLIDQAEARAMLGVSDGATDAHRLAYAELAAADVLALVKLLRVTRTASVHDDLGVALRDALATRILSAPRSAISGESGDRVASGQVKPAVLMRDVKVHSMTITATDQRIVVDLRMIIGEKG